MRRAFRAASVDRFQSRSSSCPRRYPARYAMTATTTSARRTRAILMASKELRQVVAQLSLGNCEGNGFHRIDSCLPSFWRIVSPRQRSPSRSTAG